MDLDEAMAIAERKIQNQQDALNEAIAMLSAIHLGYSYEKWEYLAMVQRMRWFTTSDDKQQAQVT